MALEPGLGRLQQRLRAEWVDNKSRSGLRRQEHSTPSYTLVNWQVEYQCQYVNMAVQVSNLLDST